MEEVIGSTPIFSTPKSPQKRGFLFILDLASMINMKCLLVTVLLACTFALPSQEKKADSLFRLLNTRQADTNRIKTLNEFGLALIQEFEFDSALIYLKEAKSKAEKSGFKFGLATSHRFIGQIYWRTGNFSEAMNNYLAALKIWEEIGNSEGMALSHNGIGIINSERGNYPEALTHFLKAQKIFERTGNKWGLSNAYNNLGNVYTFMKDYDLAIQNFHKALKIQESSADKLGIGNAYNNLGKVYLEKEDYNEALKNFKIALKVREEMNDKTGVGYSLMSIGSVYFGQYNIKEALKYHLAALKICEEINNEEGIIVATVNIGMSYLDLKQYDKAREFLEKGLALAKKIGSKDDIKESYEGLEALDRAVGDYKGAYYNYKMLISYRDSLVNEENTRNAVQQQMQFDFDKKQSQDSLRNSMQLQQKELEHTEEINRQRIYTWGGLLGLVLMALVAVISFNAYRQKQKANLLISEQKKIVEEKQKEILDSIRYAKRIQQSLLPTSKYMEKSLDRLREEDKFSNS
jgi:tetratricopeptide (TPR) repeat protein